MAHFNGMENILRKRFPKEARKSETKYNQTAGQAERQTLSQMAGHSSAFILIC